MSTTTGERPGRGRRRDPEVDRQVLEAALVEYGRTGWAAFTMDAVAKAAGVGKSSLYLRWPTKELLLADAIEQHTQPLTVSETGSLHGDAMLLATNLLVHLLDPIGWATLRVAVDAALASTHLEQLHGRVTSMHDEAGRELVARAIARGELAPDVPVQSVVEGLFGSVLVHALALSPSAHEQARRQPVAHVAPLVELVLAGARAFTKAG
ncbi:MAG: putative TetR-family transcriptional regulator [Acidimicrobiales bacterium]|nr:putative TetR-family transcriptional regulator [Acidimicrobiales bacterium]